MRTAPLGCLLPCSQLCKVRADRQPLPPREGRVTASLLLKGKPMRVDAIPEIGSLSTAENILLVQDLWDSIAADAAPLPVPRSHLDELERRWERSPSSPGDRRRKQMSHRLRFFPEVAADAVAGSRWHEERSPGLGEDCARMVYARCDEISRSPLACTVVAGRTGAGFPGDSPLPSGRGHA